MTSDSMGLFVSRAAADTKASVPAGERRAVQPSDDSLMEGIKQGDREALGHLFDRYAKIVFGVSARILRNATEAQDLVQDVFLQVYNKCHLFDAAKGSVASWLLRITYSRAFDRREYLTLRGWSGYSETEEVVDRVQIGSSLEALTDTIFAGQIVERAFSELSQRERHTLEMFFFEGYTLREISVRLDETIINTRHHYYRAIDKLRAALCDGRAREVAAD
jgi:RNA polymerase sigma-70 factor (ECF subfamily)